MRRLIKIACIGLLLYNFCISHTLSQNLIPNPGFEIYDTCPSQLKKVPWKWQNIESHADYYNSCAPGTTSSVPVNYLGYQNSHTGCGYEGICCFDSYAGYSFREFIQAKLDSTLTPGVKYYVTFNLSLFDGSPYTWTGTNKFGCKLSVNSFSPGIADSSPAVDNYATFYSDSIVIDTAGWATIRGSFVADSAYNYISFGCFFDDQHVQQIVLNGPRILTYYYLDDVCLSSDSSTCISVSQQCYVPNTVKELEGKYNAVFPNPFNEELKVEVENEGESTLTLYNVFGVIILRKEFNAIASINTDGIQRGIYFYRITNKNGIFKSGKILKE